ncbi:MAG: DUF1365 domain-containing protein [Planctomycetes bacterium]|nr:DUF1365 domain-containing protein [Planctomycetota bacterium]
MQGIPGCSIYYGRVRHRRYTPRIHSFSYSLFLVGIDLDRAEEAMGVSKLLGYERFAHSSFRRTDYYGDPSVALGTAVRNRVEAESGFRPTGPIELVTQLRTFGYSFNPVSFYYCWTPDRSQLQAILVEITNTPWGERHSYVLPWQALKEKGLNTLRRRSQRWAFRKDFHISPFSPMEIEHDWRFAQPGQRLSVHMINRALNRSAEFDATLLLKRHPFTRREVRRALLRHPFLPGKSLFGIYWQALKLFLKRAPFHAHPAKRSTKSAESS